MEWSQRSAALSLTVRVVQLWEAASLCKRGSTLLLGPTRSPDFPPSGYQAFHTAIPAKAGLNQSGRLAFHFRMVRSVKANPADAMPMNPTTGSGLAVFFYNPLKT